MESFKQEKIGEVPSNDFKAIKKEREAKIREHEREKFGGDYSKKPENLKAFIEIGLSGIIEKLPSKIKAVQLGGAGGRLAESVKKILEGEGKNSDFSIVDVNKKFLEEAEKRGFGVFELNLVDKVPIERIDLAIMRNVLHYNSIEDIKKILRNIKDSLKPEGYFVNQVISGKDQYHVEFINKILSKEALGRGTNYLTKGDYLKLCEEAGFDTKFAGDAPAGKWTLKEMFWRTYPKKAEAQGVEDLSVFSEKEKEEYFKKRDSYVEKCKGILESFSRGKNIEDIDFKGVETEIEFTGPIFVSQPKIKK
ncbi:class I SAM-dependent methyltransferase [Candidatus Parcubacteria bacterium]|nr:MAG: class I SAM-dependent methyltransferase [Candidatus Parcubacteria bacterium]